jgi:hypothetical protein
LTIIRPFALSLIVTLLFAFPATARADYWQGFGYGTMSPGADFDSGYDSACFRWDNIYFVKNHVAKGTIAWINTSGGWPYSVVNSYETIMSYTIYPDIYWTKKLYAKNTSSISYVGDADGLIRETCV